MEACPACGGHIEPWRTVASSEPGLAGRVFELRRCLDCGSAVTMGPSVPELHESGAYSPGTPRLHRVVQPILNTFDRQRLALLRRYGPPPGRLLDAGAGRGRFVLAASRAGYLADGIEPSERGVDAARTIGAELQHAAIGDAGIEPGSRQVVTLWHVLEHLDDPADALGHIRGWLEPGGLLLVGVPNLNSVQARLGGSRWYHLDVPRHRVHFTAAGLDALLRRTGFVPLHTHHLLLEHNVYGMWQSVANRLTGHPSYLYNLLKRNAPVRTLDLPVSLAALALTPVAAVLELAAGLAHRGGTIAVLARSPGGYH